jgi:threonine dehydratase
VGTIGTCSEVGILRAMRMIFERMKQVVEPSSSVPLACLLERTLDVAGARVGIIVTGGNVDLDTLQWS